MRFLRVSTLIVVSIGVSSLAAVTVAGQASAAPRAKSTDAAKKSAKLRTAWGHPDLQGTWLNNTATPLERPGELGGKDLLSDDEAAEFAEREAARNDHDKNKPADIVGNYNEFWYDRRPLWDVVVIGLCLGGAALSAAGMWLGLRRVGRGVARLARPRPVLPSS